MTQRATRRASAKINLTLNVTGQRADGYHLLDSLVVFTEFGDDLALSPADTLSLSIDGPMAMGLAAERDNLILRAAQSRGATGAFSLTKRLPVASGMGGGSSDAAAALHLIAPGGQIPLADLMRLGADLPVCMAAPQPSRMAGLGERVSPVPNVPALWMVLVNPGVHFPTPAVFKALTSKQNAPMPKDLPRWQDARDLADWLTTQRNDLQPPATDLAPVINTVLGAIAAQPGCRLARMTGSGATCFGLFDTRAQAETAARAIKTDGWFVQTTHTHPSPSNG